MDGTWCRGRGGFGSTSGEAAELDKPESGEYALAMRRMCSNVCCVVMWDVCGVFACCARRVWGICMLRKAGVVVHVCGDVIVMVGRVVMLVVDAHGVWCGV